MIVPDYPARILDCALGDISATGIRFISPEPIRAEGIVAVEVDLRLILAEVRHCETRLGSFSIGVRRLHEIEKFDALADPVACVQAMIHDLHRHIAAGNEPDSASLAQSALQRIIGQDGAPEAPVAEPAPAEPIGVDAEIVEPPAIKPPVIEASIVEPEPVAQHVAEQIEEAEIEEPEMVEEIPQEPEPVAVAQAPSHPQPATPPAEKRGSVDLLEQIRNEEARKSIEDVHAAPGKSWHIPAAIAAILIVSAAGIGTLAAKRFAHPAVQGEVRAAAPAPQPAPAIQTPPPADPVHHAEIKMLDAARVSITADDRPSPETALQPGDVREVDFSRQAVVKMSSWARMEVTLDGNALPVTHGSRMLEVTPGGVQFVKAQTP